MVCLFFLVLFLLLLGVGVSCFVGVSYCVRLCCVSFVGVCGCGCISSFRGCFVVCLLLCAVLFCVCLLCFWLSSFCCLVDVSFFCMYLVCCLSWICAILLVGVPVGLFVGVSFVGFGYCFPFLWVVPFLFVCCFVFR